MPALTDRVAGGVDPSASPLQASSAGSLHVPLKAVSTDAAALSRTVIVAVPLPSGVKMVHAVCGLAAQPHDGSGSVVARVAVSVERTAESPTSTGDSGGAFEHLSGL